MTTAEDRRPIRTNPKVLGTIGMIAAPMMLVEVLLARSIGLPGGKLGRMEGVLGLIYLVGFVCSTFGLRMLRVAGKGSGTALLFGVQIIGLLLAACQNLLQILGRADTNSKIFQIADTAWPFSQIFMLAIGVATLRGRVWTDWRKFIPLLCGLALPLAVAAAGLRKRLRSCSEYGRLRVSCLWATQFVLSNRNFPRTRPWRLMHRNYSHSATSLPPQELMTPG